MSFNPITATLTFLLISAIVLLIIYIIVSLVQAIIGITINLLRIAYNHIKVINIKLKSKRELKRLQSFKFELHPDLTKD